MKALSVIDSAGQRLAGSKVRVSQPFSYISAKFVVSCRCTSFPMAADLIAVTTRCALNAESIERV
jgi:hypothetical protein